MRMLVRIERGREGGRGEGGREGGEGGRGGFSWWMRQEMCVCIHTHTHNQDMTTDDEGDKENEQVIKKGKVKLKLCIEALSNTIATTDDIIIYPGFNSPDALQTIRSYKVYVYTSSLVYVIRVLAQAAPSF